MSQPDPDSESQADAPDNSKVGFGAMGDVTVTNDQSRHHNETHQTHHEDKSRHVHHHHHGSSGSGGERSSASILVWAFAVLTLSIGAILILVAVLKPDPPQSEPSLSTTIEPEIEVPERRDLGPAPAPAPETPQLRVRLNQAQYRVGDLMEVEVEVPQEGYLYVIAVWADGTVATLFPNQLIPDARVERSQVVRLPGDLPAAQDGRVMRYPMAMPSLPGNPESATESVIAVLSPTPLPLPSHAIDLGPEFQSLGTLSDQGFRTRGPRPTFIRLQSESLDLGGSLRHAVHYQILAD